MVANSHGARCPHRRPTSSAGCGRARQHWSPARWRSASPPAPGGCSPSQSRSGRRSRGRREPYGARAPAWPGRWRSPRPQTAHPRPRTRSRRWPGAGPRPRRSGPHARRGRGRSGRSGSRATGGPGLPTTPGQAPPGRRPGLGTSDRPQITAADSSHSASTASLAGPATAGSGRGRPAGRCHRGGERPRQRPVAGFDGRYSIGTGSWTSNGRTSRSVRDASRSRGPEPRWDRAILVADAGDGSHPI